MAGAEMVRPEIERIVAAVQREGERAVAGAKRERSAGS